MVDIGSLYLNTAVVHKALLGVNISKGGGSDNISPLLLRECADNLAAPLQHIFNLSLKSYFPTRWKVSQITRIRADVENYRGVAILPTFGKLFESIITGVLADKFKGLISIAQHGFMKNRSTSTNLVNFVSDGISVIESGCQLDTVYTKQSLYSPNTPLGNNGNDLATSKSVRQFLCRRNHFDK